MKLVNPVYVQEIFEKAVLTTEEVLKSSKAVYPNVEVL